jgi:DNA-binding protein HU-beta
MIAMIREQFDHCREAKLLRLYAVFAASRWPESLEPPSFQGAPRFDIQIRPENRALQQQKLCRSRHPRFSAEDFEILSHDTNQPTGDKMAVQMTKSQLIEKISGETEVAKKDVKGVLETLATVGYKELKKSGVFLVPGFAKFVVIKKPATKARQGTNPFTGEAMTFKAKPARKIVRARPVKAAKDAV